MSSASWFGYPPAREPRTTPLSVMAGARGPIPARRARGTLLAHRPRFRASTWARKSPSRSFRSPFSVPGARLEGIWYQQDPSQRS